MMSAARENNQSVSRMNQSVLGFRSPVSQSKLSSKVQGLFAVPLHLKPRLSGSTTERAPYAQAQALRPFASRAGPATPKSHVDVFLQELGEGEGA